MTDRLILCEDRGAVRILTINRPGQQNKLSIACMEELHGELRAAECDASCRVIVLTALGRYFCNGGELGDYRCQTPVDIRKFGNAYIKVHSTISRLSKPVVAAVQGDVFGGGTSLLEACDLAVAAEDVQFGTPEITVGIAPMMAMAGLVRVRNRKGAMEMAMLGEAIDARQALANGWINWICSRDELMPRAVRIAQRIAERNPVAVSLCKKLYGGMAASDYENQLEMGLSMLVSLLKSEDAMESLAAREEERTPVWRNR